MSKDILYTKEDLLDHLAVASLIQSNPCGKILVMYHNKYNFWTVPMGKVKPNQSVEQALIDEMAEEVGILPTTFEKFGEFYKEYVRNGKTVTVTLTLFSIISFDGVIKNNEPHKHSVLKFVSMDELYLLEPASDALNYIKKYFKVA